MRGRATRPVPDVQVDGASLVPYGGRLPNGSPDALFIEGHAAFGMNITSSAEVILPGQQMERVGFEEGQVCPFWAGEATLSHLREISGAEVAS
jgi:hypothetical protein